jgi:major membrane immunogen (membrane-anchored lipoprotein)
MKILTKVLIVISLLLIGCTNSEDAYRALRAQGFTDIHITGYDRFACSDDDFYHTGFIAINVNGIAVSGTVCSGMFLKNATIRY